MGGASVHLPGNIEKHNRMDFVLLQLRSEVLPIAFQRHELCEPFPFPPKKILTTCLSIEHLITQSRVESFGMRFWNTKLQFITYVKSIKRGETTNLSPRETQERCEHRLLERNNYLQRSEEGCLSHLLFFRSWDSFLLADSICPIGRFHSRWYLRGSSWLVHRCIPSIYMV